MADSNLSNMMSSTIDKIKGMVDANTIIGSPIKTDDGVTVIPVSKVSYGFGSGGTDFDSKKADNQNFGGGAGAGITITPIAFIVITNGETKIMQIASGNSPAEKAITAVPDIVDKIVTTVKDMRSRRAKPAADDIDLTLSDD
ncbi:MAG: GerW family sporulation protein [Clostridia bacterium]|nr:GerW family sporulation protein [Clostridia bacterium]